MIYLVYLSDLPDLDHHLSDPSVRTIWYIMIYLIYLSVRSDLDHDLSIRYMCFRSWPILPIGPIYLIYTWFMCPIDLILIMIYLIDLTWIMIYLPICSFYRRDYIDYDPDQICGTDRSDRYDLDQIDRKDRSDRSWYITLFGQIDQIDHDLD